MRWISVNDQLPSRNERVLVFCKPQFIDIASRPSEKELSMISETWEHNFSEKTFDNADWFKPLEDIEYWMPLPSYPSDGSI